MLSAVLGIAIGAAAASFLVSKADYDPARLYKVLSNNPAFLADHPDLIDAAMAVARDRHAATVATDRARLLSGKWAGFIHPDSAPSIGAAGAGRVIVEFTDYTCEPCRPSSRALRAIMTSNPELRLAVMLLPTRGPIADFAARVAAAAYRQDPSAFATLHFGLMDYEYALSQDFILQLAATAGLDLARLQADMAGDGVRGYLEEVREFAGEVGVVGVPAFVIDGRLLTGGSDEAVLREFVAHR